MDSQASQSLDDIASLLVQLEASDEAGLAELRAAFHQMVASPAFSAAVKTIAVEALLSFDDPRNTPQDAERFLAGLRSLVERAQAAHEGVVVAPVAKPVEEHATSDTYIAAGADRSLLGEFVGESREYLDASEAALLRLETDAGDMEAVNTIFRAFHTIKGTSAFLGVDYATGLAHEAETLLDHVRDGSMQCTSDIADLVFRSIDVLKEVMDGVEKVLAGENPEPPRRYNEILEALRALERGEALELRMTSEFAVPAAAAAPAAPAPAVAPVAAAPVAAAPAAVAASAPAAVEHPKAAPRQEKAQSNDNGPRVAEMLRVRTDRLDRLIEMVGELVIAQSMLMQDAAVTQQANYELSRKVGHADKIVRELQDLTMGMRMVPLKAPFQKVARLARDLAHRHHKLIDFMSEGEDTEIDRNLVDVLGDPLVHMIRNAIDHGIELPDDREKSGKPRAGQIRIAASHIGGNVVVELHDDGRGLNRERIIAKAIKMRLIDTADGMTESEIYNLIFRPGFSTAEQVTDISGRGVGMDVVRRNVEAMRGRVEIMSRPGNGTTFTIRLPLTLAITDGMLIRVGQERYLVPTEHIRLSFRPEQSQLSTIAGRGEVVMLRGEVLPIVRLHRLFNVEGAVERPSEALLMLVGEGRDATALLVDELLGQHQVVAKSLGDGIGRVPGVSGGAILGDGRVGLILDVAEISSIARRGSPSTSGSSAAA